MELQTAIKVVYYFLLPKFIEDCNQLLPDAVTECRLIEKHWALWIMMMMMLCYI